MLTGCDRPTRFSSSKVLVEGPTVTKDSETLGLVHLGGPNLQLVYVNISMVPAHHVLLFSQQNPKGKTPQQCQVTFCGCILGTVIMMESYDV